MPQAISYIRKTSKCTVYSLNWFYNYFVYPFQRFPIDRGNVTVWNFHLHLKVHTACNLVMQPVTQPDRNELCSMKVIVKFGESDWLSDLETSLTKMDLTWQTFNGKILTGFFVVVVFPMKIPQFFYFFDSLLLMTLLDLTKKFLHFSSL